MKNTDRVVTWCLVMVAASFWVMLAWMYFTHQPKDSFFVGPAVAVTGITLVLDVLLLLLTVACAVYGIWRRLVTWRLVAFKWLVLAGCVVLSFYLQTLVQFRLFPFLGPP